MSVAPAGSAGASMLPQAGAERFAQRLSPTYPNAAPRIPLGARSVGG